MSTVKLKVNGRTQTLDIDPATPLLYILRNDLGLQGPRFGCGLGQCGSCTVLVNGNAVRSCITPVSTVKGEITTLEGLAKDGKLHPLQQAWIDEQAPQCGFCQNGQIMAGPDCTFAAGCQNIATQSLAIFERLGNVSTRVIGVDERMGIVWLRMAWGVREEGGDQLTVWEAFKVYDDEIHAVEAFMKVLPVELRSGGWE